MQPRSQYALGARLSKARQCLSCLAYLTGSVAQAAYVMARIRLNRTGTHQISFRGRPLLFRGTDRDALQEVLVDKEYAFVCEHLAGAETPVVVDIGAHIGTFAIWTAGAVPNARIVSVEADPQTFRVLQKNFAAHGIDGIALHRAATQHDGGVVRFRDEGPSMSHRVDATGKVEVPTISLDKLVELAGGRVDLAKIDIEGSEEALLAANSGALANVGALVIELHPRLCDADAVRAALAQHYSSIVEIQGRTDSKPLLYCRNTA